MSELYDSYRLYFMLERKNERNNQFQHTSHLLSESVLTAACVSRAGTSSVVEAYTGLSHSFGALAAYTAESSFQLLRNPTTTPLWWV